MRANREPRARSTRPSAVLTVALGLMVGATSWWQGPVTATGALQVGSVPAATAAALGGAAATAAHPVTPRVRAFALAPVDAGSSRITAAPAKEIAHLDAAQLVAHVKSHVAPGSSLVGVTWAAGEESTDFGVALRTRRDDDWSAWTELHVTPDEGPAAGEDSQVRDGTEVAWVGAVDAVEAAVYSPGRAPAGLRLEAIDPGTSTYDAAVSTNGTLASGPSNKRGYPEMPDVISRKQWGADERLGDSCFAPRLGTTFKMVFVHHTVTSNSYSRRESAAIVRGIYAYHTQSRGWCDIGYNFLVDRFGRVFEGRDGGILRPVRGAHAGDYNVNSTGISLMGNFETATPTKAMKRGLVTLVAWRLGTAYYGAYGPATVEGKTFRRISGHRDAMSTACPGQHVYEWLPRLRQRVAHRLAEYRSGIRTEWQRVGGLRGDYGAVRIGERIKNGGRITVFRGGRMYSTGDAGLFAMRVGRMLSAYVNAGETGGYLGYPVSKILTPRSGRAAHFRGGTIYWSRATGTSILKRSAVLKRYRAESGALGRLGFPTRHLKVTEDATTGHFQHGKITFNRTTKRMTVTYE